MNVAVERLVNAGLPLGTAMASVDAEAKADRRQPERAGNIRTRIDDLGLSPEFMAAIEAQAPPPAETPARRCPALREDEELCEGGAHPLRGVSKTSRECPLKRYRSERRRLAGQLAHCGYGEREDELEKPIGPALWKSIQPSRQDGVAKASDLRAALLAAKAYRDRGWNAPGHLALVGDTGTVKSHLLFSMYFAALWDGVKALYLTTADLRTVAKDLESHTQRTSDDATARIATWCRYSVLVFDDIGDRLTDQRSRDGGSTKAAAVLLDVLNGHAGKHMLASNFDVDALREHPDVGHRQASRLFADHKSVACTLITLFGEDQRQHALRGGK